jgi:putative RecB family exonuclease
MSGIHFYAFLCETVFGRRPAEIRLMYLVGRDHPHGAPRPVDRFMTTRTNAVWKAVATACERDDFRPKPSTSATTAPTSAGAPSTAAIRRSRRPRRPVVLGQRAVA